MTKDLDIQYDAMIKGMVKFRKENKVYKDGRVGKSIEFTKNESNSFLHQGKNLVDMLRIKFSAEHNIRLRNDDYIKYEQVSKHKMKIELAPPNSPGAYSFKDVKSSVTMSKLQG